MSGEGGMHTTLSAGMAGAEPGERLNADLRDRLKTGQRHALRDRQFLRNLQRYFRPGPILELGASTGHLAAILQEYGYDVTASEVAPRLVRAIESRGVKAALIDATADIVAQAGGAFPNILAQGVAPLIYRDRGTGPHHIAARACRSRNRRQVHLHRSLCAAAAGSGPVLFAARADRNRARERTLPDGRLLSAPGDAAVPLSLLERARAQFSRSQARLHRQHAFGVGAGEARAPLV